MDARYLWVSEDLRTQDFSIIKKVLLYCHSLWTEDIPKRQRPEIANAMHITLDSNQIHLANEDGGAPRWSKQSKNYLAETSVRIWGPWRDGVRQVAGRVGDRDSA